MRLIPQPHRLAKRLLVYYHILRCATTCLYGYRVELVTILVSIRISTSILSVNNVLEVGIFPATHSMRGQNPLQQTVYNLVMPPRFLQSQLYAETRRGPASRKTEGIYPLPPRFQEPSRAATSVRHASNSCEAHHLNIVTPFTDRYDTWCDPTRMLLNHINLGVTLTCSSRLTDAGCRLLQM